MLGADTKPIERIVWSADVPNRVSLMVTLDSMPELQILKIDRLFIDRNGLDVISQLNDRGLKVFDDAKIVEIPSKAEGIAKVHLEYRPWMLNCMAGIVSSMRLDGDPDKIDGLKRFADACHATGTRPCAVTVLTSKTAEVIDQEFNGQTSQDQVLEYVEMLLSCGFTDVVCSPKEVSVIREYKQFDKLNLNTPGIRLTGGDVGDQARVDTPKAALDNGSDRLIIGRPITQGNPAENLRNIVASIS